MLFERVLGTDVSLDISIKGSSGLEKNARLKNDEEEKNTGKCTGRRERKRIGYVGENDDGGVGSEKRVATASVQG